MAHLWKRNDARTWAVFALDGDRFRLDTDPPRRLAEEIVGAADADGVLLLRERGDEGTVWILLAGARWDARVNGLPLPAGIRVLSDRDEIRVADQESWYFSVEEMPLIVPFPEAGAGTLCPRCKSEIAPGRPAVRCPHCGVWHHQDAEIERPCWTYAERCAACGLQETPLEAEFRWTPCGL